MREFDRDSIKRVHPHAWLWEPLQADASFVLRSMFGTKAVYLGGKMTFCFAAKADPWRGVLVCTSREHHASLVAQFSDLSPHPVLPKWLYLSEASDDFERVAERLVGLARQRDLRLGIVSPGKKTGKPGLPRRQTAARMSQGKNVTVKKLRP